MKTYKNIGFGPRKSKKGFTLIELLIVMVILAILAGVVVMAIGGVFGTSRERAYDVMRQEIKNAVAQYASENAGNLPTTNSSMGFYGNETLCESNNCTVINMSALLVENRGILGKMPEGSHMATPDAGSYVWTMDTYGNVYSACNVTAKCIGALNGSAYLDGFWEAYP